MTIYNLLQILYYTINIKSSIAPKYCERGKVILKTAEKNAEHDNMICGRLEMFIDFVADCTYCM